MNELVVDYISDLHLSFYLKASSNGYEEIQMDEFISRVIEPQAKGEILVVAGDITEFTKHGVLFLKKCAKYYKKVFFVAGNHEYYISYFLKKVSKLLVIPSGMFQKILLVGYTILFSHLTLSSYMQKMLQKYK